MPNATISNRSTTDLRSPQTLDRAPDAVVTQSHTGEEIALSSMWASGPVVLVFLRHFGCSFCREQVSELRVDAAAFVERNVRVALITLAPGNETDDFCVGHHVAEPFVCLSDPDRRAYRAYSLSRGGAHEFFAPHVLARGFQAAMHGHFVGMPKGDPFQMPGLFIVDQIGVVRFAHRNRDAADNLPIKQILAVLDGLINPHEEP